MQRTVEVPTSGARTTGWVYLLYFVVAICGALLLRRMTLPAEATATMQFQMEHALRLRCGVLTGLVADALYLAVTIRLYALLRPVNLGLARLAVLCSAVGCAVQAMSSMFQLAPLTLLEHGPYLQDLFEDQLRILVVLCLRLRATALSVGLVFFACFCLVTGYLIARSSFLPRSLGILLGIAGLGWLIFPLLPMQSRWGSYLQGLGFMAELLLLFWLVVKGVDEARWREQNIACRAACS